MSFLSVFLFMIASVIGLSYYLGDSGTNNTSLVDRAALFFPHGQSEQEADKYELPVSKKVTVSITNINGPIKIKGIKGTTALIKVTKRGSKKDFERIKIEKTLDKSEITLKTLHLDHDRHKVSVGYQLEVPFGADIALAKTVNGSILVQEVAGDLNIHTANGMITCQNTSGSIEAYSVNGTVKAVVKQLRSSDTISLETINGSLEIILPKDIQTELHAQTAVGKIKSDFDLQNQKSHFVGKKVDGILGGQDKVDSSINLKTTNGAIHIRRSK